MFKATIQVTLRPSILDPQGKAIEHALANLGFDNIEAVRVGKHVEVWIDAADRAEAEREAETACAKLLANPVMEDYAMTLEEVAPETA